MTVKFGPDFSYFLWSFAAGVCLALIYDVIRAMRIVLKMSDIMINLLDIVFVVMSAIIMVVGGYEMNNGEFRVYSGVTIAGAFVVYNLYVGKRLTNLIIKFSELLIRLTKLIVKMLLTPVRLIRMFYTRTSEHKKTKIRETSKKQV